MSEIHGSESRDYSRYDQMSTKELEQILRTDAMLPDNAETDTDLLFYIMEVLAERNKEDPSNSRKSVDDAYDSFQKNYLHCSDLAKPLYGDLMDEPQSKLRKIPTKARGILRLAAATAAVLAIIFCGSLSAYAFGFDVWEKVARWTENIFYFENHSYPTTNEGIPYTSLQDALRIHGITEVNIPTWIPDGYKLAEVEVSETSEGISLGVNYQSGEKAFSIVVRNWPKDQMEYYEKDTTDVEVYSANNTLFYIFENNGYVQVTWLVDNYECSLTGQITYEETIRMIESIFE